MARLVLVAGSASLLDSSAIISVGSTLALWRTDLALDDVQVGAISATMTASIAVGALIGGRVADKLGRGRVFADTVGLYAVGAFLVFLAATPATLVVAVAVLGFASGADLPASIALVADLAPAHARGRLVAATHVMWTVGIVLASAAAFAAAPYGLTGMRAVFAALAVLALATWAARRHALGPTHTPQRPTSASGPSRDLDRSPAQTRAEVRAGELAAASASPTLDSHAPTRTLVRVALFYILYTLVSNTYGSFRPYLLVTVGGVTQSVATGIAFALTVLGLLGTLLFTFVADSRRRRTIYPFAAVVLVGSQATLAVGIDGSLAVIVGALTLYTLAYPYVGEALYKVWSQEVVAPQHRATFQGVTIAAARALAALFALLTPTLLSRAPAGVFWLVAVVAAAAVAVGWSSRNHLPAPRA